jgi:succinate dehydrogenase/fumarate reductase flavoprotein subunit
MRLRSGPVAPGDGLRLALGAGAANSHNMDKFYGHSMIDVPLPPSHFQKLTPYFARASVLVNRDGRRFVDESDTFIEEGNAQAACRQWGGTFYVIFDQRMYEVDRAAGSPALRSAVGDWLDMVAPFAPPLWTSGTLDGLIAEIARDGVPAASLKDEIERYNRACRDGKARELAPARTECAWPLERPPFRAVRCVPAITATSGGIAVDDHLRVLDAARLPLPGLFAAGVDAGGVFGRTYGGFLGWSLVSGRKAGRSAADYVGNKGN